MRFTLYVNILWWSKNWAQAINIYVKLLEEWIEKVKTWWNTNISLWVPMEEEYVKMLLPRVEIIKDEILSVYQDEL